MAERKSFLLRIDADVLDALRRWAADDLRSVNAQVEFLLRESLRTRGRLKGTAEVEAAAAPEDPPPPEPDGA